MVFPQSHTGLSTPPHWGQYIWPLFIISRSWGYMQIIEAHYFFQDDETVQVILVLELLKERPCILKKHLLFKDWGLSNDQVNKQTKSGTKTCSLDKYITCESQNPTNKHIKSAQIMQRLLQKERKTGIWGDSLLKLEINWSLVQV